MNEKEIKEKINELIENNNSLIEEVNKLTESVSLVKSDLVMMKEIGAAEKRGMDKALLELNKLKPDAPKTEKEKVEPPANEPVTPEAKLDPEPAPVAAAPVVEPAK